MIGTVINSIIEKELDRMIETLKTRLEFAKEILLTIIDFFKDVVNKKINEQWEELGRVAGELFSGNFKSVVNFIIEKAVGLINDAISSINSCINIINGIPGVNISTISTLDIPQLAQGGYVGANMPQLAVIGDNKREGEIVSPESKIQENVVIALQKFFGGQFIDNLSSAIQQGTNTSSGDIHVHLEIDGQELTEIMLRSSDLAVARGGAY